MTAVPTSGRSDSCFYVTVRDLRTGLVCKRLSAVDDGPPNIEDRSVRRKDFTDLAPSPAGSVVNFHSTPVVPEVHVADRLGRRKLAGSAGVVRTSLQIRNGAVDWRTAAGPRRAPLDG